MRTQTMVGNAKILDQMTFFQNVKREVEKKNGNVSLLYKIQKKIYLKTNVRVNPDLVPSAPLLLEECPENP